MKIAFDPVSAEQHGLKEFWYDWYYQVVDVRGTSRIFCESEDDVKLYVKHLDQSNPFANYWVNDDKE
jgi:hypothetical protein